MSASRDRVQRAFESLIVKARLEHSQPPTAASVATHAGISRSSMYRFHARVVTQIQRILRQRQATNDHNLRLKCELLARQLKAEKELSRALARACAELAAEKVAMKEAREDERLSLQLRVKHLEQQIARTKKIRLASRR